MMGGGKEQTRAEASQTLRIVSENDEFVKKATESQLALARRFVDTLCEKDSGLALYTKGYACYGGNRLYPYGSRKKS